MICHGDQHGLGISEEVFRGKPWGMVMVLLADYQGMWAPSY